jgi:phosphoribosylformylglycinamidine synthase subunit PurQ / glutaminase
VARENLRIALMSIEGTNCDEELRNALHELGARPEIVHLKQFEGRVEPKMRRRLSDYQMLFIPGGFSAGDYVRAGAIMAARLRTSLGPQLEEFIHSGRLVGGVCNGFQVLVELGLLPGRPGGHLGAPEAALLANASGHFECRPTYLRWEGGRFAPLKVIPTGTVLYAPTAHAEGQLTFDGDPNRRAKELERDGQVIFRYVRPDGRADGYPWNPNGSVGGIAGLTNPEGNVFGLMPHPERAFSRILHPDWTRSGTAEGPGDGHRFFSALLDHAEHHG